MVKIVPEGNSALRKKAKEVPVSDITERGIKKIISDMKTALDREKDGIAIAAPQIGVSMRIFVVSGKAFALDKNPGIDEESANDKKRYPDVAFINPELVKLSKRHPWQVEGCLSVRWLYGKVKRAEKATIKAYDEHGKKITRGASGLLSQIFQHEIDHLDGILFIDKAKDIEEMPPEKYSKEVS